MKKNSEESNIHYRKVTIQDLIILCIILIILYIVKAKNYFFLAENLAFTNIYLSIILS